MKPYALLATALFSGAWIAGSANTAPAQGLASERWNKHSSQRLHPVRQQQGEFHYNPPPPRDIHLRVSRFTSAQAAVWHQHALDSKGDRP